MKFLISIVIFFVISNNHAIAQLRVANYSIGKYGTPAYEHFSFYEENNKRAKIEYSYGIHPKDIQLVYLGKATLHEKICFKVEFSNKYVLFITPDGSTLKVEDESGKYHKLFKWEYEGPVNGVGTFCDACAGNETEAMDLLKKYYLQ